MSDRDRKLYKLKRQSRKSILMGILTSLIFCPIAGFLLGTGVGFFWLLFCSVIIIITSGFGLIVLIPLSVIAIPLAIHSHNKKTDLELDLKYGD
jgi:hypothetical protein